MDVAARTRLRHPQYYFKDGSMIIFVSGPFSTLTCLTHIFVKCAGTLYNIHQSVFEQRSRVIADLMNLPQGECSNLEGKSDEHPIVLAGLQASEFEFLLVYMYNQSVCFRGILSSFCDLALRVVVSQQEAEPSIPYLVALMKMSGFFEVPDARSFAIKNLERHAEFSPALQLQLARQYDVAQWLEPAFRALVWTPLKKITVEDAATIGGTAYYVLSQTKVRIDDLIRAIAYCPPPLVPGFCDDPERCELHWNNAWWQGYAKVLLHPDRTFRSSHIFKELFDTDSIPQVCTSCFRFTLDDIYENRNPSIVIEDYIETGLEKLKRMLP